jgi:hypothetical protein
MFEPLAAPDSFPQSAARRHGACLRDRRESSKHPTPYVSNPGRRNPSLQDSHPPTYENFCAWGLDQSLNPTRKSNLL